MTRTLDHRGSFEVRLDRLLALSSSVLEILPEQRWRRLLIDETDSLLDELTERFAFEEEGGYLEPIVVDRPELSRSVDRLRQEHARILADVGALAGVVAASEVATARKHLRVLVQTIRRHERDEIRLIQEATLTDVGVVD